MDDAKTLPPGLREAILAEIDQRETLRWCGQPVPARILRKAVPQTLLVFLVLGMFACMASVATFQTWRDVADPSVTRSLMGGNGVAAVGAFAVLDVLLVAGAGAVLTAPWWARAKARRTVYALTNTRVMILVRDRSGRTHTDAVEPGHPLSIARREHADGSGDIILYPYQRGQRGGQLVLAACPRPREVERLIRTTFDPPQRLM